MAEAYICSLSKVQRHAEICKEINKLYEQKNHDYGDSFHQTFVEEGMAMARIRLGDKLSRFKTLSLSRGCEQKVNDESIRDTLIDLANYAIMTVLEMEVPECAVDTPSRYAGKPCCGGVKYVYPNGFFRFRWRNSFLPKRLEGCRSYPRPSRRRN